MFKSRCRSFARDADHGAYCFSFGEFGLGSFQDPTIMAAARSVLELFVFEETLLFFTEQKTGIAVFAPYIFVLEDFFFALAFY